MAFPLAHPAAVLPFRRRSLKWLNFPALVIGTLVPDLGYLFPGGSDLSHEFLGSLIFGVPVGCLILAAFYAIRMHLVARMPAALKRSLVPVCQRPPGPVLIILLSLVIGLWTHVLWDSVTHPDGWLVEHVAFLSTQIGRAHV